MVVEKILEGTETLPADWETAGTTGYEALWRIQETFVDPGGAAVLGAVMHRLTGDTSDAFAAMAEQAKREIVDGPLYAEVHRLTSLAADICRDDLRLRDHTWRALEDCLIELLVAFDRYRAYVVPGENVHPESLDVMATAAVRARTRLSAERSATMDVVVDLLLGREVGSAGRTRGARRDELIVRFQQTCGAVMAKGVEDTAFYRWTHLTACARSAASPSSSRSRRRTCRPGRRRCRSPPRSAMTDPLDARHQARRGHPRSPRRRSASSRASGRRSSTPCAPPRPRTAAPCSTAARSTCSGRRWPARGRTTARSPRNGWWST